MYPFAMPPFSHDCPLAPVVHATLDGLAPHRLVLGLVLGGGSEERPHVGEIVGSLVPTSARSGTVYDGRPVWLAAGLNG